MSNAVAVGVATAVAATAVVSYGSEFYWQYIVVGVVAVVVVVVTVVAVVAKSEVVRVSV